jgi:hypothetical protein
MQWQGVLVDTTGQHYTVLVTGDSKWHLFYPLLGNSTIIWGEGFPVLKSSLPRNVRRALAAGWSNTHLIGAVRRLLDSDEKS